MKKLLLLAALCLAVAPVARAGEPAAVVAPVFTEAVPYNDYVVERQNEIGGAILGFTATFDREELDMALTRAKLADMQTQIARSTAALEALGPFQGSTDLRDGALQLFRFYKQVAAKEYVEMVDLLEKATRGELTPADEVRLNAIVADVTAREAAHDAAFGAIQTAYAARHGMQLERNELQDAIDGM